MRKTLYTLNIGDYAPEITRLTYPLLRLYARKLGAEFCVIDKRAFDAWPVVYEKLQVYSLAEERGDEWSIYLDGDALVHPETVDWTAFLPPDHVAHNGTDMAGIRWRATRWASRDRRWIGSCNWCAVASSWCRDLWRPLDMTPEDAVAHCFPTVDETNTVITPEHLVDDFALSQNIARFGLKVKALIDLQKEIGLPDANFFWHAYTVDVPTKVAQLRKVIAEWKLQRYAGI